MLHSEASPEDRFHRDGLLRLDVRRWSPLRRRGASLQQSLLHLDGCCSAQPTGGRGQGSECGFQSFIICFQINTSQEEERGGGGCLQESKSAEF